MVSASGAERILNEVAHARVEIIPECGHCPQVECPQLVFDLIADFAEEGLRQAA
jgi:pimeloyl-ACP methyl ester carboxylesterase